MAQVKEPVSIDGITFDALIDAEETWQSDVPAYPVETGFEVSDTIIIRPVVLKMGLFLTNTPVTWKALHGSGPGRVQDVTSRLRTLYFKKTPVLVKTTEQDYENMAIESIGLPTKLETGTSKLIPIILKQIVVTEVKKASIPASFGRGGATGTNAGTANTGTQTATGSTGSVGTNASGSNEGGDGSRGSILYNLSSSSGLLGSGGPLGSLFGG